MTVIAVNAMIMDGGRLSGIGHYTVQLLTWFARLNEERGGADHIIAICRPSAAHHLQITGVDVLQVEGRGGRIARVLAEQFRLPSLLRRYRVDAVLNPAFTGPVSGAATIVTTVHDLYFKVVPTLLPRAQRLFLSSVVPFCCRHSAHVVTTSEGTRADLIRLYPDLERRAIVVPMANRLPGPSAIPIDRHVGNGTGFVLMVAALTGNKNPEPLVEAVALLRRRWPDITLLHVGSDPQGRLRDVIARLNAMDWVSSRSGVSDEALQALYGECLCVAVPSLSEGFGLPVLEAQAFGAPVVASRRAALPEVGGNGALYFDPTDPVAIAEAIGQLISSPQQRDALRRAGFVNQQRFSWEQTARAMLDLLRREPGGASTAT